MFVFGNDILECDGQFFSSRYGSLVDMCSMDESVNMHHAVIASTVFLDNEMVTVLSELTLRLIMQINLSPF